MDVVFLSLVASGASSVVVGHPLDTVKVTARPSGSCGRHGNGRSETAGLNHHFL